MLNVSAVPSVLLLNIVFSCTDVPQVVYPSTNQKTFELFSVVVVVVVVTMNKTAVYLCKQVFV